jgi:hypothetical protein
MNAVPLPLNVTACHSYFSSYYFIIVRVSIHKWICVSPCRQNDDDESVVGIEASED